MIANKLIFLLFLLPGNLIAKDVAMIISGGCDQIRRSESYQKQHPGSIKNMFEKDFKTLRKAFKKNKWEVDSFFDAPKGEIKDSRLPTMDAIAAKFAERAKSMKRGDQLFLQIDTHGRGPHNNRGSADLGGTRKLIDLPHSFCIVDEKGREHYIKASEFLKKIKPHLKKMVNKGVKLAMNSDACFGGGLIDALKKTMTNPKGDSNNIDPSKICALASTGNKTITYTQNSILKTMICTLDPKEIPDEPSCKDMKRKKIPAALPNSPKKGVYMDDLFLTHLLYNPNPNLRHASMFPDNGAGGQKLVKSAETLQFVFGSWKTHSVRNSWYNITPYAPYNDISEGLGYEANKKYLKTIRDTNACIYKQYSNHLNKWIYDFDKIVKFLPRQYDFYLLENSASFDKKINNYLGKGIPFRGLSKALLKVHQKREKLRKENDILNRKINHLIECYTYSKKLPYWGVGGTRMPPLGRKDYVARCPKLTSSKAIKKEFDELGLTFPNDRSSKLGYLQDRLDKLDIEFNKILNRTRVANYLVQSLANPKPNACSKFQFKK